MDQRRTAAALFALAACFACSTAAPTASNQTALDLFEAPIEGCYYNFQHYGEGDRIMTNEPCLNCTCHNRMLMCYLRVCPFTKPIGQDCTMEKRADQCCPIVTCPDVPVDLLTSTSTSSPAEYGENGLGKVDRYGCSIHGKYFPEGAKVPPTPNKPCEHCYCIHNMTTCVMQECTLHVDGCTPIYHKDVCCPIRYSCDHPEEEIPLLDDMTTTVRPTPGFLLTTTTMMPATQVSQDCIHEDKIFADGALIKTEKACEHCYCMKGDIVCVVQECGTPMENEGKNCTSLAPKQGQCCPDTYICEGDELSTSRIDEETTTLSPPRRFGVEGSGYRNEPDETYTEATSIGDIEIEGSGEEPLLTTMTNLDSGVSEVTSRNVYEYSTEINTVSSDITTMKNDIEKDDNILTTIPSFDITPVQQTDDLSKGTDIGDVSQVKQPTPTEQSALTTSIEDNVTQKQDDISIELTTTAITLDQHTTVEPIMTTKINESVEVTTYSEVTTKHSLDDIDNMTPIDEEFIIATKLPDRTESIENNFEEPLTTTKPVHVEEIITQQITIETTPQTSTEQSTHFIGTTASQETTAINVQENEILEETLPARIPGEGDCLSDGVTYNNNTSVPSASKCHSSCKCISSIIKCDPIICTPPLEYMENMNDCQPIYDTPDSCCPTYVCSTKETIAPESHSQMSGTETPKPIECVNNECQFNTEIKTTEKPAEHECGSDGCQENQEIGQSTLPQNDLSKCIDDNCDLNKEQLAVPDVQPCDGTADCLISNQVTKPAVDTDNQDIFEIHTKPCNDENGCQVPVITPCTENDCKIESDIPDKKEGDVEDKEMICKDEICRRKEFSENEASNICSGTDCIQKDISLEISSPKPEHDTQSMTESEPVKESQDFTPSEKYTTLPTLTETNLGIVKEESTSPTSMVEETTSVQSEYSKLDKLSTELSSDTPDVVTVKDLAATKVDTLEDDTTTESILTITDKTNEKPEVVSKEDETQYSTTSGEIITKNPKLEFTTSEAATSTPSGEDKDEDQSHVKVPSYLEEKTTDKELILEEVVTTTTSHLLTSTSHDGSMAEVTEPETSFTKKISDSDLLIKPLTEVTEVPEFTSEHSITEQKEYAPTTVTSDSFTKKNSETKLPEAYATSTEGYEIQPSYTTISYGDEPEKATTLFTEEYTTTLRDDSHKVIYSQLEHETSSVDSDIEDNQTQKTTDKETYETITEASHLLTTEFAQKDNSQLEQETSLPRDDIKEYQTDKTMEKDVSETFTEETPLVTTELTQKDNSQLAQETSVPYYDTEDYQTQKTMEKDVTEAITEENPLMTTEFTQKGDSQLGHETSLPHDDMKDYQTQKTIDKGVYETYTEETPLTTTEFTQKDNSQLEQETSLPHDNIKDYLTQKTVDKGISEAFTEESPLITTEGTQKDNSSLEQETYVPYDNVKDYPPHETTIKDVSETYTEESPLITTEFADKENTQFEKVTSSPHDIDEDYQKHKTTDNGINEIFTEESSYTTTEVSHKDNSGAGLTDITISDKQETHTSVPTTKDTEVTKGYSTEVTMTPLVDKDSSDANSELEQSTEILGTIAPLKEDELFTESQEHAESSSPQPTEDKKTTPEKVIDVTDHILDYTEPQDFTTKKTVENTIAEEFETKTTETVISLDDKEATTPSFNEISKETTVLYVPSSSETLSDIVSEFTTESDSLIDTNKNTTTEPSYGNADVQTTKLPELKPEIQNEEKTPSETEPQSTDKPYVQSETEDGDATVTMPESTESSEKLDSNQIPEIESENIPLTTQSNNMLTEATEPSESQFTKDDTQKQEKETVVESSTESKFSSKPDLISSTSPTVTIIEEKEQEAKVTTDSLELKEKETIPPVSLVTDKPLSFETTETITENVQIGKVTEAIESKPLEETGTQMNDEYEKTKSSEVIELMTTKQVNVMIQTVTPSIESSSEIKYSDVSTEATSNLVNNEQTSDIPAIGDSEQTVINQQFTTQSEIEMTSISSIPQVEDETKPKLPHIVNEDSVEMSTQITYVSTEKTFEDQSTEPEKDINKLIVETPVPEVTEYPVLVDQTQQKQLTTDVIDTETTKKTDQTTPEPQSITTVHEDSEISSNEEQTSLNNLDEKLTTTIVEIEPEVATIVPETPKIVIDEEKPKDQTEPEIPYETQTYHPTTVKEETRIPTQYPLLDTETQDITKQPLSEKNPTTIAEEFIPKPVSESGNLDNLMNVEAITLTPQETFTTERILDDKLEATTETKYEHSETTPYFVELEEHTHQIMLETTVIPTEETSTGQATERGDQTISDKLSDELQTQKSTDITSIPQDSYPGTTESNQMQSTQGVYQSTSSPYDIPDISSSSEPQEDTEIKKQDKPSDEGFYSTVTPIHESSVMQNEEMITSMPSETKKPETIEMTEKSQTITEEEEEKLDIPLQTKIPGEYTNTTTSVFIPEETSVKTTVPDNQLLDVSSTTSKPLTTKPEYQPADELPAAEFPPSGGDTSGYGQDVDNGDEAEEPFGPGTCRYGGKVYVSAQQIPRDDPCDFCFCFRSDIICLQQSCPPPIHGCHEEPIQGFCCPRYECPVSMATTLNVTTTTTTTTTTLPPHFLPHAYKGAAQKKGCYVKGHTYKVGEFVRASSGPCLHCTCGGDGQMKCDPKACTPEPMLRQMIAAAVSARRRR